MEIRQKSLTIDSERNYQSHNTTVPRNHSKLSLYAVTKVYVLKAQRSRVTQYNGRNADGFAQIEILFTSTPEGP